MDLVVFENNKPWVIDEFREGHFDYVELASDVAETKFFQFLFGQQVVDRLVQHYPSPRDRHHVPLWMYVSSQLTLRLFFFFFLKKKKLQPTHATLHGQHSFHSYPLIVRAAGWSMRSARRSRVRQVDPESGNLTLECGGLQRPQPLSPPRPPAIRTSSASWPATPSRSRSRSGTTATSSPCTRNSGRSTPMACSSPIRHLPVRARQPSLRGLATVALRRAQPSRQQETGTGDARKPQRARCRWRRCYKAVLLLHCDAAGERFVVAGVRVSREKESEATALWPLLNTFLDTVGSGVMKVLLVDRGFINGPEIGRLKRDHGIDTVIPIRSDMNLQEDVHGLMKLPTTWEEYEPTASSAAAGSNPSVAWPATPPRGEETGTDAPSRRWPASELNVSRSHRPTRAAFGNEP